MKLYSLKNSVFLVSLEMLTCTTMKVSPLWGEWHSFATVLLVQGWFGYAFLSFLAGKTIVFTGGGRFDSSSHLAARWFAGGLGLVIYIAMFFYWNS